MNQAISDAPAVPAVKMAQATRIPKLLQGLAFATSRWTG